MLGYNGLYTAAVATESLNTWSCAQLSLDAKSKLEALVSINQVGVTCSSGTGNFLLISPLIQLGTLLLLNATFTDNSVKCGDTADSVDIDYTWRKKVYNQLQWPAY